MLIQAHAHAIYFVVKSCLRLSPLCTFPARGELASRECSGPETQVRLLFSLWCLSKAGPLRSAQAAEATELLGQGPSGLHLQTGGREENKTCVHLPCQRRGVCPTQEGFARMPGGAILVPGSLRD